MIISQIPHVIGKCKKINEMVEIPKKKIKRGYLNVVAYTQSLLMRRKFMRMKLETPAMSCRNIL